MRPDGFPASPDLPSVLGPILTTTDFMRNQTVGGQGRPFGPKARTGGALVRLQPVPRPRLGLDEARIGRVVAELAAQLADVYAEICRRDALRPTRR